MIQATAYYRTSSASNVGFDKDSEKRQREYVLAFARHSGIEVVADFYDAAVSGSDPIDARAGFLDLLKYCEENDVHTILVENASRFARDLTVQLTGHALLRKRGIELIPVDAPTCFTDPSPTAVMISQILGAVAQFEKASLVTRLRHARDAKRAETGRCEGRKPACEAAVARARALKATRPALSLRGISQSLAIEGFVTDKGTPHSAAAVARMLA
jgi:DNA invertase Pin-like site-specific DNA recombinase